MSPGLIVNNSLYYKQKSHRQPQSAAIAVGLQVASSFSRWTRLGYSACNNPTASAGVTIRTPW